MHKLRQQHSLIYCVSSREQLRSERAASHVSLVLALPVQYVYCGFLQSGYERLGCTSWYSQVQGSSKTMAFLRVLLEGRIRNDAQMSVFRGQLPVAELLGASLNPFQKLIQLPHMLHLGVVVPPLECHNEHHHVEPCMSRVCYRSQQGDKEAV